MNEIKKKFKNKENRRSHIYIAVLLVILIPYYALCFYSYPALDDFNALRISEYDSFYQFLSAWLKAGLSSGRYTGTYVHSLIQRFTPLSFNNGIMLFQIGQLVMLCYLIYSIFRFFTKANKYLLKLNKDTITLFTCIMVFIMLDTTATADLLYGFWSANINYLLIYALILNAYSILIEYFWSKENFTKIKAVVLFVITPIIMLSNVGQAFMYLGVASVILLWVVIQDLKQPVQNILKYKYYLVYYTVTLGMFCLNFFTAMGGRVQSTNGYRGMEFIREYIIISTKIYFRANIPIMIIVLLIFLPKIIDANRNLGEDEKIKFKNPIIFTIISFGLWSTLFATTIYGVGLYYPPRLMGIFYLNNYIFFSATLFYWTGYFAKRGNAFGFIYNKKYKVATICITLFVLVFMPINGKKSLNYTIKNYETVKPYVFNRGEKFFNNYIIILGQFARGEVQYTSETSKIRDTLYNDKDIQYIETAPIEPYWYYVTVSDGRLPMDSKDHWTSKNITKYYNKELIIGNMELEEGRMYRARGEKTGVVINENAVNNFDFEFGDTEINSEDFYEITAFAKNITDIDTGLEEVETHIVFFDENGQTMAFPIYLVQQVENDLKLYATINGEQLNDGIYSVAIKIKDDDSEYYSKNDEYVFEKKGEILYLVK